MSVFRPYIFRTVEYFQIPDTWKKIFFKSEDQPPYSTMHTQETSLLHVRSKYLESTSKFNLWAPKDTCSITTSCCAWTAGSNKEQWAETGHQMCLQTDNLGRKSSRGELQRHLGAQWEEGRLSGDSEGTYICMDQVGSWISGGRSRTWYERQWAEQLDRRHVLGKSLIFTQSCYIRVCPQL